MPKKFPNISGVVLAGGKNSRYGGQDKSFIKFEDKFFIDRIFDVYNDLFEEIIVISNRINSYSQYKFIKTNSDYYKEIGPLAGLHSAMDICSNKYFFVLSCDMPFPDKTLIEFLLNNIDNYDALIPTINEKMEPLHAVYNSNKKNTLIKHIEQKEAYSIRSFLNKIDTKYIEIEQKPNFIKSFLNINSEKDYYKHLK